MSGQVSPSTTYVGRPQKRSEDPKLITGRGQYVEDIKLPELAHLAFLRSLHAHARVTAIRADAARSAPGVLAVVTAKDLGSLRPLPFMATLPGLKQVPCAYLAGTVVNATGVPVAAVVAESASQALRSPTPISGRTRRSAGRSRAGTSMARSRRPRTS